MINKNVKIRRTFTASAGVALCLIGVVVALGLGCSPRLKATIGLPQIPAIASAGKSESASHAMVFVSTVRDGRQQSALAELDGKPSEPASSISPAVQDALQRAFQQTGFLMSEDAPIVVSSEVQRWIAHVTAGVPSKAQAESVLYVEILDPANKRIYAGTYQGFADMESPSMGERDVQQVLGASMSEAIKQIVNDRQLITMLSSF